MEKSILETLGVEIIGVMSPVSICMLLVVFIVSALPPDLSSPPLRTAATLLYLESPSDPPSQKLTGALLNAAAFVVLIALVTFLLLLLYYYRFTLFLKHYIHFSSFFVFSSMGAPIFFSLLRNLNLPLDSLTSILMLFNFTVVGVFSVFSPAVPIVVRQGYMVALAVIVAAWFAKLPEWTTWVLLVALAVYDLVAVLAPGGPLKLLVELASSREEDLPALIYEARPAMNPNPRPIAPLAGVIGSFVAVVGSDPGSVELQRLAAPRRSDYSAIEMEQGESPRMAYDSAIEIEQGEQEEEGSERSPLVGGNSRRIMDSVHNYESAIDEEEMSPLTSTSAEREGGMEVEMSRGIKLGLGDFVFYSVLVGRAAMYDLMTVYACYLAIISGLGCTLILLSVAHRALPALPISIALGVMFYFLTRLLMEPFVVGTSTNLMMF